MKSVLEISDERDKRADALKRDAERKRLERQRAKTKAQFDSIQSKEDLWKMNRALLSQQELAALLEREDFVFALLNDIRTVTENRSPDEEFAADVVAEIEEDVKQRGVVTMELVLLGNYWQMPLYSERFQGTDPDSVFARLGLLIALPSHSVHSWDEFIAVFQTANAKRERTEERMETRQERGGETK